MSVFIQKVKALKHSIEVLEQHSVLMPEQSRFNDVLKECVNLLRDNHYTVKAIPKIMSSVKDVRGLVALFYNELQFHYPDTVPYKNESADMRIAKDFVKKIRELTSTEYVPAVALCAHLIIIVFKYRKEFGFKPGTLYNFRVFGQDKMHWVTEKALFIYNRERQNDEALQRKADILTEQYEKTHDIKFGYGDVAEIQKLIDNMEE